MKFGYTGGAQAFTLGYVVTINEDMWNSSPTVDQMTLLAHEFTHTLQFASLDRDIPRSFPSEAYSPFDDLPLYTGVSNAALHAFLSRYSTEFSSGPSNYQMPKGLDPSQAGAISLYALDWLDKQWTLDQIAERSAAEVLYRITGHY